jgi:hypothetical protein
MTGTREDDCGPAACSLTEGRLASARVETGGVLEAIETCFERGWTDGLPVLPPTPAKVAEFLDAAGLAPGDVVGTVPTRDNLAVTAEKLAVNAVMAGARPEYMPVIAAAMRALCDPRHNLHAHTATLSGAAQIVIVNGPVRRRLGINSQDGVFGPGWRANATIGRALRLAIRNVLRSVHGEFDRASFSQPARFTACFGEDEEESPWPSVAADAGFGPGDDAVTVFSSMWQAPLGTTTRDPQALVRRLALAARWSNDGGMAFADLAEQEAWARSEFYEGRQFLFVLGREHAGVLAKEGRFDKPALRQALYEELTRENPLAQPMFMAGPQSIMVAVVRATGLQQSWFFCPFYSTNPATQKI